MTVDEYLSASRRAHKSGKAAKQAGRHADALAFFQVALDQRLAARKADPTRTDASWLADALAPPRKDEKSRTSRPQYHRVPGLTLADVVAIKDAELEHYFRVELGDVDQVQAKPSTPEIVTPKQWVTVKAGAVNPETGASLCPRGHRFQLLAFDRRACTTCGMVEDLIETKAVEETLAFQQLQKESRGKV